MTTALVGGSQEPLGVLWDLPLVQMRWDLTGTYASDPDALIGTQVVDARSTYAYVCPPGAQLIIFVQYVYAGITEINLLPEFDMQFPAAYPAGIVTRDPTDYAMSERGYVPCSYRVGADVVIPSPAQFTPLILRRDYLRLPTDMYSPNVEAGSSAPSTTVGNVVFYYISLGVLVRFRVEVSGTAAAGDRLAIALARGALRGGSVGGAGTGSGG